MRIFCFDNLKNGEELCSFVFFFLLFSTQNQVYRNGSSNMSYLAFSIVIRITLKISQNLFHNFEKNRFEIFDFRSNFELIGVSV